MGLGRARQDSGCSRPLGSWVSQAASTGLFADRVAPPPAGGRGDGPRSVPGCRPRRSDAARRSRWATASGMAGGASWKGCGAPAPAAYRAWATWRTPPAPVAQVWSSAAPSALRASPIRTLAVAAMDHGGAGMDRQHQAAASRQPCSWGAGSAGPVPRRSRGATSWGGMAGQRKRLL